MKIKNYIKNQNYILNIDKLSTIGISVLTGYGYVFSVLFLLNIFEFFALTSIKMLI